VEHTWKVGTVKMGDFVLNTNSTEWLKLRGVSRLLNSLTERAETCRTSLYVRGPNSLLTPAVFSCTLILNKLKRKLSGSELTFRKWKADFARARVDGSFDCHRSLAADMWRVPYDETPTKDWTDTNQPTKRYIAKRCRHGLNYRMQEYRLGRSHWTPLS
jgi:hypothetical protein